MKFAAFLLAFAFVAPAFAKPVDQGKLAKVQSMAKIQEQDDIKVEVTHEDKIQMCGAEGPAFVVEIKVKRLVRDASEQSEVGVKEKWETVKSYGILDKDVFTGEKLFDNEGCLE